MVENNVVEMDDVSPSSSLEIAVSYLRSPRVLVEALVRRKVVARELTVTDLADVIHTILSVRAKKKLIIGHGG